MSRPHELFNGQKSDGQTDLSKDKIIHSWKNILEM